MKSKLLFLSMLMIVVLAGCSQEKEATENEKNMSDSVGNVKYTEKKPPQLKIEVNEEEFSAALGGYAWSYFDQEENSMVEIEAEAIGVSELVGDRNGPIVNTSTSIELQFEEEPISYQVNIWDSTDNLKGSFKDVVLDGQSGKTIYEVVATWERGTGYYVFPLTIK
ncbi:MULTISPECIES: hypothetical protein [Planococcus]|uniref:Lipoprotein n=1 Tax=Planococcus faecalis TaxID=1598147 RepID=A0ABM6IRP2_9BACL|nr:MULTISPECIES: hypothetical protein [Planococcus]AQU79264.1 hypothetical protein AJGP001_08300 [Planococcus faecalis]MDJ0332381.1 hypothetical protein [Planococcus sp. S3-L1]OHX52298.1 hypothetical protein BB777_12890 [Planococcus faecalis]